MWKLRRPWDLFEIVSNLRSEILPKDRSEIPFREVIETPLYPSWSRAQNRTARRGLENADEQLERLKDESLLWYY